MGKTNTIVIIVKQFDIYLQLIFVLDLLKQLFIVFTLYLSLLLRTTLFAFLFIGTQQFDQPVQQNHLLTAYQLHPLLNILHYHKEKPWYFACDIKPFLEFQQQYVGLHLMLLLGSFNP